MGHAPRPPPPPITCVLEFHLPLKIKNNQDNLYVEIISKWTSVHRDRPQHRETELT